MTSQIWYLLISSNNDRVLSISPVSSMILPDLTVAGGKHANILNTENISKKEEKERNKSLLKNN